MQGFVTAAVIAAEGMNALVEAVTGVRAPEIAALVGSDTAAGETGEAAGGMHLSLNTSPA